MTRTATGEAPAGTGQPHVTILTDRCAGCQECVIRCPSGALTLDAGRWVAVADDALCVGCRQCERTCPFSAITVTGPLAVASRTEPVPRHPERLCGDTGEVRKGFGSWDEALAEASRCLNCPDPTCVRGCPAHNDIPSFISAIRDQDLGMAHDVLRRTSVLPDVCSRVCDQAAQCEGACTWSLAGAHRSRSASWNGSWPTARPYRSPPEARRVPPASRSEWSAAGRPGSARPGSWSKRARR
jgi:glutamate synthase (NADPH) small chain